MLSSQLLLCLGGHASTSVSVLGCQRLSVCDAHMPQSRPDPAPRSRGHAVTLSVPPAARFLFRPGDGLKPLPPLSRLHRPLKVPHSAIAHAAVLGRTGKAVRSWELLSGFGTINVISNRSLLRSAEGRAGIQSRVLLPPCSPYFLNDDGKHKREEAERPQEG